MFRLVAYTLIVALAVAFVLMLANKWRVLEWLQVHSDGMFHQLVSCHFCTTFWTALAVSAVVAGVSGYWPALACAVLSTPIAVRLW